MARVVALGASNLTRGLHAVVSTARTAWGPDVQIVAALGHGRSYGARSRVLFRTLPGILDSGLWPALESRPRPPTRALVTDVGNDILYGFSPHQTLAWVDEALGRLSRITQDIVVTELPLASIRSLTGPKFLAFGSVFVPFCRLSFGEVLEASERVNDGLARLAETRRAKLLRPQARWYGFDPIHVRPSLCREAWQQILGIEAATDPNGGSRVEGLRLYLMRPERRWMFGVEQFTPQAGVPLPAGGRVWLY